MVAGAMLPPSKMVGPSTQTLVTYIRMRQEVGAPFLQTGNPRNEELDLCIPIFDWGKVILPPPAHRQEFLSKEHILVAYKVKPLSRNPIWFTDKIWLLVSVCVAFSLIFFFSDIFVTQSVCRHQDLERRGKGREIAIIAEYDEPKNPKLSFPPDPSYVPPKGGEGELYRAWKSCWWS